MGPLISGRIGHMAGRYGDRLVVAGGWNGRTEIWDKVPGQFTLGPPMNTERAWAAGGVVGESWLTVVIFGRLGDWIID